MDDNLNLPSRRAMLGGLSVAAAAVASLPAAATTPSDEIAQLLAIERELDANQQLIDAQYEVIDRCGQIWRRALKPCPRRKWRGDWTRTNYHFERAKARYAVRFTNDRERSGLAAAEARMAELREHRDDVANAVWKLRATSLEGLKIKARISQHTAAAAHSAIADLLAMGGGDV